MTSEATKMDCRTRANTLAGLLLIVLSSCGAFGVLADPRFGGGNGVRPWRRGIEGAEPRLFAPFNANISANIQNAKMALGSPQNSLTFLLNVIIAVGQ